MPTLAEDRPADVEELPVAPTTGRARRGAGASRRHSAAEALEEPTPTRRTTRTAARRASVH
jgi:hypothetical protein